MNMQSTNRITRKPAKRPGKPAAKPTPETEWPDIRVALGPAPETPFVADEFVIVAPGFPPQAFATNQEAGNAAYDIAEANPGLWVEVYGRLTDSPGWMLLELIGIPSINATFAKDAASWIVTVRVDADSCRT